MADLSGSGDGLSKINDALLAFTGCIGESLADLCSYGLTLGEAYVPFDPDEDDDCDEDDVMCAQAWVRVAGVDPILSGAWQEDCGVEMQISLEVGVLRCYEIREGGEAPTASQVLVGAAQAMDDMNAIFCAAMDCEVWNQIDAGSWSPVGPRGDQYGGTWSFTVRI